MKWKWKTGINLKTTCWFLNGWSIVYYTMVICSGRCRCLSRIQHNHPFSLYLQINNRELRGMFTQGIENTKKKSTNKNLESILIGLLGWCLVLREEHMERAQPSLQKLWLSCFSPWDSSPPVAAAVVELTSELKMHSLRHLVVQEHRVWEGSIMQKIKHFA